LIDDVDAPTTSHTSELIELLLHRGAGFKSRIQIARLPTVADTVSRGPTPRLVDSITRDR